MPGPCPECRTVRPSAARPMSELQFEILDVAADSIIEEAVHEQLREFNRARNPVLWDALDAPEHASRPLNVVAFDAGGRVAGGLFAETRFAWMKVAIMAVRQDVRGRGIGKRLMRMAEEEAIRRGCKYAFTDTMDYQAPGFYHRLGYATAGRIEDWDSHGHAKYFLVKQLAAG